MRSNRLQVLGIVAVAAIGIADHARAQTFTESGTTDTASAVFSLTNGGATLQVVLSNTSTITNYTNPDVLSGLFFSIAGNPTLNPASATASNMVNNPGCSVNCDVSANFGYVYSASGFAAANLTTTAQYGIASAGYSSLSPTFGSAATFNHQSGGLGGLDYSIVGPDYTGGNGLSGSTALVEGSVTFDFTLPTPVTSLSISNVTFGYGTAPDGAGSGGAVPEPAGLAVFGTAAAVLGLARRRRRGAPKH